MYAANRSIGLNIDTITHRRHIDMIATAPAKKNREKQRQQKTRNHIKLLLLGNKNAC